MRLVIARQSNGTFLSELRHEHPLWARVPAWNRQRVTRWGGDLVLKRPPDGVWDKYERVTDLLQRWGWMGFVFWDRDRAEAFLGNKVLEGCKPGWFASYLASGQVESVIVLEQQNDAWVLQIQRHAEWWKHRVRLSSDAARRHRGAQRPLYCALGSVQDAQDQSRPATEPRYYCKARCKPGHAEKRAPLSSSQMCISPA